MMLNINICQLYQMIGLGAELTKMKNCEGPEFEIEIRKVAEDYEFERLSIEVKKVITANPELFYKPFTFIDKMPAFFYKLANIIENIGATGKTFAKEVRELGRSDEAQEIIELINDSGPGIKNLLSKEKEPVPSQKWIRLIAIAILDNIRLETKVPAITKYSLRGISPIWNNRNIFNGDNELVDREGISKFSIPVLSKELTGNIINGIGLFKSITGHRLITWLIMEGFYQHQSGMPDSHCITVRGGCSKIAKEIGETGRSGGQRVKNLLKAMAHGEFRFHGNQKGNLLVLTEVQHSAPGQPHIIRIELGNALRPQSVHFLPKKLREKRHLVPVLPSPPFVSSAKTWGAQWAFQWELVSEFVTRHKEYSEKGFVIITDEKLAEMARKVSLPKKILKNMIERWKSEDGLLVAVDGEESGFKLSSKLCKVAEFIKDLTKKGKKNRKRLKHYPT
jgi:hypothetical protein